MKRKQSAWARFLALLDKWFPREKPRKRICGTCSKQIKRKGEPWHGNPPHHDKCKAPAKKRVPRARVDALQPGAEELTHSRYL